MMSTRSLVAAACLVAFLPVGAEAQQVGFGVKAGVSLGDLPAFDEVIDEPNVEGARLVGYAVGGFLAFRFDNGLSIQPEVLYTQKGVKYDFGSGAASESLRIRADYLDIPILGRYTFGKGVRGYVFGGPSFDFRRAAKITTGIFGQDDEEDVTDDVEAFEFAVVFGGGIELGPVLIEARWSEGLTDIVAEEVDAPDKAIKTRTVVFLLGLRF